MSHDMGTQNPGTQPSSQQDRQHSTASEAAERTAAIALWVVVGVALVYGVSETGVRVAQLFT